jgi:hypothetical protein
MADASLTPADGRPTTARGPARALELLKQDVALLEATLELGQEGPHSSG